ncbi:putative quinol monooxygenase [Cellulomonas composti]|uniref:ABM domain-containing protein n=1 Tax=Cellulomonas composti TaxID=266130 RepID=A0A511JEQ6_9CELL|nr:hypothetical protein [Cellulomonas composti]GEL96406.1 hypothetical protein CCO02nite_30640 [Cellulomonas composti]
MITLYLRGRVPSDHRPLEEFLRRARLVYDEPAGIRTRLQWSEADPTRFVEIVEYRDRATYDADQRRVETDPRMRALLAEWRTLLDGPPDVEAYEEHPLTDPA